MKVFISGFGTVGQGVAEAILVKEAELKAISKDGLKIVGIMDSKSFSIDNNGVCTIGVLSKKKTEKRCGEDRKGKSGTEIMDMVDYDVLVECSPTNIDNGGEGLKNIEHALKNGKDVVTVNKGPLALKFSELMKIAEKNGAKLRYEGSVGGAMPMINLCNECLAGQKIKSIRGIFNGTCNFILSRMDSGLPFEQALREAQQLGYAETDPTYDIKGIDSACKVTILANSVFKRNVTVKDVSITGIDTITEEAVALAKERDMVIRLIGEVTNDTLQVSPRLIPKGHPLSITGTLNTALVETDMSGPITVSGRGAGRSETASAILSDLIALLKSRQ